jgi:RNA polymerase sigma factor (sigma-70 family)
LELVKKSQQKLIEQCKKGNQRAQFELYEQYADSMYNIAYRITGTQPDAEDALQEAFIKAFQKIGSFKGEATFGSWLKRIVVNQCISDIRKRKAYFEEFGNEAEKKIENEDQPQISEKVPINKVMDAIDELPDGARVVFTLKAVEEYKFKEIAEMLNLSESNCKVQYHRSKKLLSKKLAEVVEM